ncbi:BNR repeat-containing protein [Vibrio metschnikovii]|uniref:BNR repeat-containing protein n=1 Tax=Vibrio metschnikovii TaxID=28172 RepID=UPI001C2FF340|nr:BNR repeat-containing protein [Vibrio metschnikovii]
MSKGHPLSRSELKLLIHDLWSQGRWLQLATLDTFNTKLTALEKAYIALANCHIGEAEIAGQLLEELSTKRGIQNKLSHLLLASHNLNLSRGLQIIESGNNPSVIASNKANRFSVQKINEIELGNAWAGNTVNTVIFRHHAIFTDNYFQYTAFYLDEKTLRFIKRDLNGEAIEYYDLLGDYNLKDAHNSISLGMDRDGFIHVCYDHHGSQLNYRRSLLPFDINGWTERLAMSGNNEKKVTYPTFILPKDNSALLVLYRDGYWKRGSAYIKKYDEKNKVWDDCLLPVLSGEDNIPWTSNPYWNTPVISGDGCLHMSFTWRTDYFDENKLVTNLNIDYAKSNDEGLSWFTSNDKIYKLPITQVNSETIWPVPPGSNNMNQNSMALDSAGYPHIAYYSNDENGIPQYKHLWFDGVKWKNEVISNNKEKFDLRGSGTLNIPLSRPEIIIDEKDNVIVIFRSSGFDNKFVVNFLASPDYIFHEDNCNILWDESVGQAEPIIDRVRWERDKILTLFIQYNDQPDNEGVPLLKLSPVKLVDFNIFSPGYVDNEK